MLYDLFNLSLIRTDRMNDSTIFFVYRVITVIQLVQCLIPRYHKLPVDTVYDILEDGSKASCGKDDS